MRKTNKVIAALVAVMMVMMMLAGCGGGGSTGGNDAVVGEWKITSMEAEGMTISGDMLSMVGADNMGFTFTADGKATANLFDETMDGTWAAKGDSVDITIKGDTITGKLDGGKLSIEIEGEKMILEKK